jgi:hypothetical protein
VAHLHPGAPGNRGGRRAAGKVGVFLFIGNF